MRPIPSRGAKGPRKWMFTEWHFTLFFFNILSIPPKKIIRSFKPGHPEPSCPAWEANQKGKIKKIKRYTVYTRIILDPRLDQLGF